MTLLDKRIEEDLKALYNNGLQDLINRFNLCKIQEAENLSNALFGKPDELSSHGLPGYFTGNRSAKTVMVMLNPGQDVAAHNNPQITKELLGKLKITTVSLAEYLNGNAKFGFYDKQYKDQREQYEEDIEKKIKGKSGRKYVYPDSFDLKQAAFLKRWPNNCGVEIPNGFPPINNEIVNKEHSNYITAKETAERVLMDKLQLELVPYASRKFDGISNYDALFPYVRILFDEIFSTVKGNDDRYVIFCSDIFDKLFKSYNGADIDEYPGWIEFDINNYRRDSSTNNFKVFDNGKAYCTPIRIHFEGKEKSPQGLSLKAIIAHTFPNQSLSKAYNRMVKYGEFCYDTYDKSKI